MARVTEETISGPFDGPRTLVHVGDETHWAVTPARAAAEIEARARLAAHPLARGPIERRGDVLVFPRLRALVDPDDALDAIREPLDGREAEPSSRTVRALLHAFGGPVDAVRGLGRAGMPRSVVDRLLGRTLAFSTPRGIDLGGAMPAAIRDAGDAATLMSMRYGRLDGWPVLDLASLALRGELDGASVHTALGGDDVAFDLAVLHQALRELAATADEATRATLRVAVDAIARRYTADAPRKPRPVFTFEPRRERRRRLFSRFFEGIQYDDEGLFSATPEALALEMVRGLAGTVVDATCGIGSLAIALARTPGVTRVIAIDRDAEKIRMARHNAGLYGVRDRIELRVGDALALVPSLALDALVIDPPWGGRDYDRARVALDDLPMLSPLLALGRPTVLKLPRSFDASTLPPDFEIAPMRDERGVLKMLVARRGVPSR